MNCVLCEKIKEIQENKFEFKIRELETCFWVWGEHDFFKGYSVLYYKEHVREITDLNKNDYLKLSEELFFASRIIQKAFQPHKLNICSLGNVVEHLHWHIFPRYVSDNNSLSHPWKMEDQFSLHKINKDKVSKYNQLLAPYLI